MPYMERRDSGGHTVVAEYTKTGVADVEELGVQKDAALRLQHLRESNYLCIVLNQEQ